MEYSFERAHAVLSRTPSVLDSFLRDLPLEWVHADEGGESWSPFGVVGHLIHGERTDWIPRARHLLEHGSNVAFEPFDRTAHVDATRGRSMNALLDEFAELRAANLVALRKLALTDEDLARTGMHPELGPVRLRELLATWVAHDLSHLSQVSRTMAHQLADEVGPWRAYLPILNRRRS